MSLCLLVVRNRVSLCSPDCTRTACVALFPDLSLCSPSKSWDFDPPASASRAAEIIGVSLFFQKLFLRHYSQGDLLPTQGGFWILFTYFHVYGYLCAWFLQTGRGFWSLGTGVRQLRALMWILEMDSGFSGRADEPSLPPLREDFVESHTVTWNLLPPYV